MIEDIGIKAREPIAPQTTKLMMVMRDIGAKKDHDDHDTDTSDDDHDNHKKQSKSTRTKKTHSSKTKTHTQSRATRVHSHESDDSDTDDDDDHHRKHPTSSKTKKSGKSKTHSHQSRTTRVHDHESDHSDDSDDSDDERDHDRKHTRSRTNEHHNDQLRPKIAPTLTTKTIAARDLGGMGIPEITSVSESEMNDVAMAVTPLTQRPCISNVGVNSSSSKPVTCIAGGILGLMVIVLITYKLISRYRSRRENKLEETVYYVGLPTETTEMEESRGAKLSPNNDEKI